MSVTESKAKTERKSSRKPAKTQETVLSALLAQTEEVSVPLASLIKSPLNVRTVPYSAESVSELADSIKGVGLLQNLVVHALPGDRYGVAAGGRRLAALNMLAERDIIQVDWPGSPGSADATAGQISGTADMDALPECVWQRGVQ